MWLSQGQVQGGNTLKISHRKTNGYEVGVEASFYEVILGQERALGKQKPSPVRIFNVIRLKQWLC
jgi:hypothetical protein